MNSTKFHALLAITVLVSMLVVQPHEATRILNEEENEWMERGRNLLLPSFQRATGPPAPSGCTWVPGGGGKPCTTTVGSQNFAGRSQPSDAYPKEMARFGVAASLAK